MLYIVKFSASKRVLECSFSLRNDELVLCEINGELYRGKIERETKEGELEGKVLRPVYPKERDMVEKMVNDEKEAAAFFKERIKVRNLPMKLVGVDKEWEGKKIKFFFISDQRVDFRELVKDLAHKYHTRIELRQIGVRDFASFVGGFGPCGRPLCCTTFLKNKISVRLDMAREQNIVVDPSKISGICGRLFCCLAYELDFYKEARARNPKVGAQVEVDGKKGEIGYINYLTEIAKVKFEDGVEENVPLKRIKQKKVWWLIPKRRREE